MKNIVSVTDSIVMYVCHSRLWLGCDVQVTGRLDEQVEQERLPRRQTSYVSKKFGRGFTAPERLRHPTRGLHVGKKKSE